MNKNRGITLIVLVITIIILLILAGVAIASLTGENGILNKSKQAAKEYEYQQAREEIILAVNSAKMVQKSPGKASFKGALEEEFNKEPLKTNNTSDIEAATDKVTGINRGIYKYQINLTTGQIINEGDKPTPPDSIQGGEYDPEKGVNTPKVVEGMIPIKWNGTSWEVCSQTDPDWYNYLDQAAGQDGQSKWANVMLSDGAYKVGNVEVGKEVGINDLGSMYVWIPRYAYSITSLYHTSSETEGGDIQIAFLEGRKEYTKGSEVSYKYQGQVGTGNITNATGKGNWNEHPAFNFGGTKVSGIWVAKFEAGNSKCTEDKTSGEAAYTSKAIKIQPNKTSWRKTTIGNAFDACMEISSKYASDYGISNDKNIIDSHLMKNAEWGCVAYLTQSNYGRNKHEVTINDSYSYLTGDGDYVANSNQSTTGNVTGIYDIAGGALERVAAYVDSGVSELTTNGASIVNADSKYKNIYVKGSNNTGEENYASNSGAYGDAIYETSSQGTSAKSWYYDTSYFSYSKYPFLSRGGLHRNGSNDGIFAFYRSLGDATYTDNSFRPVLITF